MAEAAEEQWRPEVEDEAEVGLRATTTIDTLPSNGSPNIVTGPRTIANEPGIHKHRDVEAAGVSDILEFDAGKQESESEGGETSGVVKEIVEEEIVEMEFEKAILKLGTHTMHCPNCRSEVNKVVLRRRVMTISRTLQKPVEQGGDPEDLVGCFSCFSFFTCSENGGFNPFHIFGKKSETRSSPPAQVDGNEGARVVVHEKENCFSMFWVFKKENEGKKTEDPPQTDVEEISTSSDQLQTSIGKGKAFNVPRLGLLSVEDETYNSQALGKNIGERGHREGRIRVGVHDQTDTTIDVLVEFGVEGEASASQEAILGTENRLVIEEGSAYLEILKSIVYGGLMEVIVSLSIVASATASDVVTLSIIALALASLVGGIFIVGHNLWDLRDDCYKGNSSQATKKYKELLGRPNYFPLHVFFAILSYLIFGLVPPVAYGVSFYETNDKDYTIVVVAIVSLLCVLLLAIFKAYITGYKGFFEYIKTMVYYITIALSVSGVSYVGGILVMRLIEELGLFDMSSGVAMTIFPHASATISSTASF